MLVGKRDSLVSLTLHGQRKQFRQGQADAEIYMYIADEAPIPADGALGRVRLNRGRPRIST